MLWSHNNADMSETMKLARSYPIPRPPPPTTMSTANQADKALVVVKRQADTTARGSTDRLEHREPHGSNGLQLRGMEIGGGAEV